MDLPTAPMAPPHGNSQSNDLHATRDYSTKTASSQRPNREPEFHQRLDRHGKLFGERISASLVSTRGPKNKLIPSLGKTEQYRKPPIDTEVETEDNIRFPAQRQSSPINRTNDRVEPRLEGCPLPVQHSPPYSTVHEGDSTHMEGTNNGHNRERGPPRTPLMPTAPDSQSLPNVPSMEAVMEELREVTYQYTNCPDPVESAARRQRVPDGEVHSLMEVTTTRIVAAAVEAQQHNQNVSIPQISPAATDRVVNAANSQSVMPAPNVILLPASSAAPTTKRRGRPPKARKHNPSPRLLAGTSSRKHNLAKAHSSPGGNSTHRAGSSGRQKPPHQSDRHTTRKQGDSDGGNRRKFVGIDRFRRISDEPVRRERFSDNSDVECSSVYSDEL
ncbi:hypothetical protein YC2023_102560 [Brassica napus]